MQAGIAGQGRLGEQLARLEPIEIIAKQRGEIVQLETERLEAVQFGGEFGEGFGRELLALEFTQREAQMLGEPGEARAGAEEFELVALFLQQSAQDHEAAFLVKQSRRGFLQLLKNKKCQALEG